MKLTRLFKTPDVFQKDNTKISLKALLARLDAIGTRESLLEANYLRMEVPKLMLAEYSMSLDDVMDCKVYDLNNKINAITSRKREQIKQMDGVIDQLESIIKANSSKQSDAQWDGVLTNTVAVNE